jgi:hypothetical protein
MGITRYALDLYVPEQPLMIRKVSDRLSRSCRVSGQSSFPENRIQFIVPMQDSQQRCFGRFKPHGAQRPALSSHSILTF